MLTKGRLYGRLIIAGLLLLIAGAAQASLLLVFAEEETVSKQDEKPVTTATKLSVEIGPDYFSRDDSVERVIYDFKGRRIYRVNLQQKSYIDDSLFMMPGFRVTEFQNRLYLAEVMEKAGVKDNPMAVTMSEHLFSILKKDHKPDIKQQKTRDEVSFLWQGKKLAGFSRELVKVDKEHKRGFMRFFRYYQAGHPQILQALDKLDGIPVRIEMYKSNVADRTTVLQLETHTVSAANGYELAGLKESPAEGELADLFRADLPYTPQALQAAAQKVLASADTAYSKKRYLDSMLAYMEYHLMLGEALPPEFQARGKLMGEDAAVKKMLASINPKSQEEAEKAVETLAEMHTQSKDRKHVLLIFEANVRQSLKQADDAKKNFKAALAVNPYIVGAWKDLGDVYFHQFDTQAAWRCWDHARELKPTHGLLKTVAELEQNLVTNFPELF
jgi:tetratricopeptide (TPR) repeat protein